MSAQGDPWDWTVDEVVHHLCRSQELYSAAGRSDAKPPDPVAFEQQLRVQEIDGATLLDGGVDDAFLKAELEIRALGKRRAILGVIKLLQAQSVKYSQIVTRNCGAEPADNHNGPSTSLFSSFNLISPSSKRALGLERSVEGPQQMATVFDRPNPMTEGPVQVPHPEPEQAIADGPQKKPRRAPLVTVSTEPTTEVTPFGRTAKRKGNPTDISTSSIGPAIPVDKLFYAGAAVGATLETDSEDDADVLVTASQFAPPMVTKYVYRQIFHFQSRQDQKRTTLDGVTTTTLYPYRKSVLGLTNKIPNVIAIRRVGSDIRATREDLSRPSELGPASSEEQSNHEWDFLNHWIDKDDKVVSGSVKSFGASTIAEIERDEWSDEAVNATKQNAILSKERVLGIIDQFIADSEQEWLNTKLPSKKRKEWSIWQRGRFNRKLCIQNNDKAIRRLITRVSKYREEMAHVAYAKEQEVKNQCRILATTIDEKMELVWQIKIWSQARPPPKLPQHRTRRKPRAKAKQYDEDDDGVSVASSSEEEIDDRMETDHREDFDNPMDPMDIDGMEGAPPVPASEDSVMGSVSNGLESSQAPTSTPKAGEHESSSLTVEAKKEKRTSEVIDLTLESDTEPGTPVPLRPKSSRPLLPPSDLWTKPVEDAPESYIALWTWRELVERGDRKRLLKKILCEMAEIEREILKKRLEVVRRKDVVDEIKRGIAMYVRGASRINGVLDADLPKIIQITRLYLCWHRCEHTPWTRDWNAETESGTLKSLLGRLEKSKADLDVFHSFVVGELCDKAPSDHLSSTTSRPPTSASRPASPRAQEISSDSEAPLETPSRRKKHIVMSQTTKDQQAQARQRQKEQEARELELRNLSQNAVENDPNAHIANTSTATDERDYIRIHPRISTLIKKHQIDGVRFMWRELMNPEGTHGCLLAHTMGLGKTMQVITLLVTIAQAAHSRDERIRNQIPRHLRKSKTLILCPAGLADNWVEEIEKWTPPEVKHLLGRTWKLADAKAIHARYKMVADWAYEGGLLIIGYELFRNLITNNTGMARFQEGDNERMQEWLFQEPSLIIADEAHVLKNPNSKIGAISQRFTSMSRIALTGTPLANNVMEYWTMINWAHPAYLGNAEEFRGVWQEPIEQGLYADSAIGAYRTACKRLKALERAIEPKVHRAGIDVLKDDLKPKVEFLITVPLTTCQERAYNIFVEEKQKSMDPVETKENSIASVWAWLSVLCLLCNCPEAFFEKLLGDSGLKKPEKAKGDLAEEDLEGRKLDELHRSSLLLSHQRSLFEWAKENTQLACHKLILLQEILQQCKRIGDKVLVFSQSIRTLDYLEKMLQAMGRSYQRLDGTTNVGDRQGAAKAFNDGASDVFLISTRAGGVGLNLPAANRVIIFDFKYNPQTEEQAIGRAYRLGQQKPVYVYRFLVGGTFESVLFNANVFKAQLAVTVVDKKRLERKAMRPQDLLTKPAAVEQKPLKGHMGKDPEVLDKILEKMKDRPYIRDILSGETLQREVEDVKLTDEERREIEEWTATLDSRGLAKKRAIAPLPRDVLLNTGGNLARQDTPEKNLAFANAVLSSAGLPPLSPESSWAGLLVSSSTAPSNTGYQPIPNVGPVPSTPLSRPAPQFEASRTLSNGSGQEQQNTPRAEINGSGHE